MSLSPFLRSPLTDLTGCIINHQQYDRCGTFELNMMECLEAYGLDKGKLRCKDLIEDFQECASKNKQMMRVYAMKTERERQYRDGERKEQYAPPPNMNTY